MSDWFLPIEEVRKQNRALQPRSKPVPSTTTTQYCKQILSALMDDEERRLKTAIDDVILANRDLKGEMDAVGVMFASGFFDHSSYIRPAANPYTRPVAPKRISLDHTLHERMQALADERDRLEGDKRHIGQMLVLLVDPARSLQQIRDALPECVVEIVPELKDLPRQREPGFTLKHPRHKEQLGRIVDRIGYYVGLKFMY